MRWAFFVIPTIVLTLCPLQAAAQGAEVVALVLEVAGSTSPATAAFTELRAGSKIALAADARLRFVHYRSCRMTGIRGGELTLLPSGHLLRDGATETDELRSCPKRLSTGAQSGVAGGLVMRGAEPATLHLSAQPVLMIAGARAAQFEKLLIEGADRPVALRRTSAAPVWRHDGPLLAPGTYRLVAFAADGQRLVDEAVSVSAADAAAPEIAILRAD